MGKHRGQEEGRTDGSWIGNDDEIIDGPKIEGDPVIDDAVIMVEKPPVDES